MRGAISMTQSTQRRLPTAELAPGGDLLAASLGNQLST